MTETKQLTNEQFDAIRQVIAESGTMDYIDVVNAVDQRFRLKVTAADVERVAHELVNSKITAKPRAEVSFDLSASTPKTSSGTGLTSKQSTGSTSAHRMDPPEDDLSHALHFVKSVGGLGKAKQLMKELEAIFVGSDD